MRIRAGVRSGAVRATVIAKHTIVSTPERPIRVGQDPDAERGDELKDDRGRHVPHTTGQPQGEPAERRTDDHAAGHRQQEGRRDRAERRSRWPPRRRRRGDRSAARWRRSAGSRLRGSSGCDAAAAAGAAPRLRPRRRAARRRRRARSPAPTAWPGISARATRATAMVVRPTAQHDQARDRRPVVPEISRRRVVGGVEQDGRDEQRQRQLGSNGERGRARNEREDRAAERQEHRIRCADAPRRGCQQHGGEDQANESFEFPHVSV